VLVIPSLDLQGGRSRLVFWPGAATGTGTPTDRPDRICRAFVDQGARLLHLVDLDGAKGGRPVNIDSIGAIARAVAVPLQVAGGVDGPEQIELAFAAGATRVVMPLWAVAEAPETLAASVRIAGDWLAVGLDARPDRLRDYPWKSFVPPTFDELVARLADGGVRRFVVSHGGSGPDLERYTRLTAAHDAEFLLAGGVTELGMLPRLRDAGIAGVILGQVLIAGVLDLREALAAAA